ncbi:hypothetical protein H3C70_03620 [Patescibacteria group bacterium]|nr:hypothetical protein [Patescibacteria group bacterium]
MIESPILRTLLPTESSIEVAIQNIYEVTKSMYWPQYFDQWCVVFLQAGFPEYQVFPAVDAAKKTVNERAKTKQRVQKEDIFDLAVLISIYQETLGGFPTETGH